MNIRLSVITLFILLAIFLVYRFVRPLQIFIVSPEFEMPIDIGKTPEGLKSISAESCGQCHVQIYEEWTTSMHANSWIDPYFQVDYAFDDYQQICLNCHTPLRDQQKNLILGFRDRDKFEPILKPNADFSDSLKSEGVTCVVCHVRDGMIFGPYGSETAPHPVKRDERMRDGYSYCQRCHMVMGEKWDTFYRIPPCGTFEETREAGRRPDCVKCHMPESRQPLVPGSEVKIVRQHLWKGGHDPQMVKSALNIELEKRGTSNGYIEFLLTIANTGANHKVPTGTPDRHLTVTFRLLDKNQKMIKEKIFKMKRTIMWRPFIIDLWDSRITAGESRSFAFSFKKKTKPAFLDVEVRYHLLDERRRRRIGYDNRKPIDYRIFYRRVEIGQVADKEEI